MSPLDVELKLWIPSPVTFSTVEREGETQLGPIFQLATHTQQNVHSRERERQETLLSVCSPNSFRLNGTETFGFLLFKNKLSKDSTGPDNQAPPNNSKRVIKLQVTALVQTENKQDAHDIASATIRGHRLRHHCNKTKKARPV